MYAVGYLCAWSWRVWLLTDQGKTQNSKNFGQVNNICLRIQSMHIVLKSGTKCQGGGFLMRVFFFSLLWYRNNFVAKCHFFSFLFLIRLIQFFMPPFLAWRNIKKKWEFLYWGEMGHLQIVTWFLFKIKFTVYLYILSH